MGFVCSKGNRKSCPSCVRSNCCSYARIIRLFFLGVIGYTLARKIFPLLISNKAGSTFLRTILSNTRRPFAFSTTTPSRIVPFNSIAKRETVFPSASGNSNSPSRMRSVSLKKVISIVVMAILPIISLLICRPDKRSGYSLPSSVFTINEGAEYCSFDCC